MQRERLELGDEGRDDQREPGECGDDVPSVRPLRTRDERVGNGERRRKPDSLRREMHDATLAVLLAGVAQW